MSICLFLKIKFVISVILGIALVFMPSYLMDFYGIYLGPGGIVMAELSGACLLGIGIICRYAGNAGKSELRDGILLALLICDSIVFAVILMGHHAGIGNLLVWPTAGLWLAMALGVGYYIFQSISIEIVFLG